VLHILSRTPVAGDSSCHRSVGYIHIRRHNSVYYLIILQLPPTRVLGESGVYHWVYYVRDDNGYKGIDAAST